MAIFHLSVKVKSRIKGQTATGAGAYCAGDLIKDERTGNTHDFRRKAGVLSSKIMVPPGAPKWATDRAKLWNAAEAAEVRKNSTVARELEIALPAEISEAAREALAHDLAREIVRKHRCAADVSIHAPGKGGDNRNHHAHILLTTRRLTSEGFTEKCRELDDKKSGSEFVNYWRERFAHLQNTRLRDAGVHASVDHRTLAAQGIERMPTQHLGPAASHSSRKNKPLDRAEKNVQANKLNDLLREQNDLQIRIETTRIVIKAETELEQEEIMSKKVEETLKENAAKERVRCAIVAAEEDAAASQRERETFQKKRKRLIEKSLQIDDLEEVEQRQRRKAEIWTDRYDHELSKERWNHLRQILISEFETVVKTTDGGCVIDHGQRIELDRATDKEIELAFEMARAKNWKKITFVGPESFQMLCARRAAAEGWPLESLASKGKYDLERSYLEFFDQAKSVLAYHDKKYLLPNDPKEQDSLVFPQAGESLGQYLKRTADEWQMFTVGSLPDLPVREREYVARQAAQTYFDRIANPPDLAPQQKPRGPRITAPAAKARANHGSNGPGM